MSVGCPLFHLTPLVALRGQVLISLSITCTVEEMSGSHSLAHKAVVFSLET